MRVLIVEDEIRLARNIKQVLTEELSYVVDISTDGEDGRHLALTNPYDLIILDLLLPQVDGLEILRAIRGQDNAVPVLILTARGERQEIVRGLNLGSDDYMTKPFDMEELLARCRSLIRRSHGRPSSEIQVGPLHIDTRTHVVEASGKKVVLPALEYRLLEYLAMRAGEIVSKTELMEHLYDFQSENFSNVIEVYISSLRRKLDTEPNYPLIHTIRGQGYLLGELPQ